MDVSNKIFLITFAAGCLVMLKGIWFDEWIAGVLGALSASLSFTMVMQEKR